MTERRKATLLLFSSNGLFRTLKDFSLTSVYEEQRIIRLAPPSYPLLYYHSRPVITHNTQTHPHRASHQKTTHMHSRALVTNTQNRRVLPVETKNQPNRWFSHSRLNWTDIETSNQSLRSNECIPRGLLAGFKKKR